jgi:hypothetical protein
MPTNDAGHGVDVNVGSCRCPGGSPTPHPDGDIVTLVPKLTLPMAASLNQRVRENADGDDSVAAVQFSLMSGYLRAAPAGAIASWSFVEEGAVIDRKTGQLPLIPVPITAEAIERLIPWGSGGMEVAEEADRLYAADFLAPFLRRISTSSKTGPTAGSTSASRKSGASRRSPSRPSLRPVSGGRKSA